MGNSTHSEFLDNNSYLLNKHNLGDALQKEIEKKFKRYYNVIYREFSPEGKEVYVNSTCRTQEEIGKDILEADIIRQNHIEIGNPYEIGFNYDINGNLM